MYIVVCNDLFTDLLTKEISDRISDGKPPKMISMNTVIPCLSYVSSNLHKIMHNFL